MRGRAPFFGAALFCALLTLRARSTREFRRATPLRDCPPSASTSARTRLASCSCESRCDPALRTTLANSSERTHLAILPRVCGHRCLRSRSCACPSNQSRASARCSLDLRVRSASHIYVAVDSWGGASRPARRARAGLGEEREPACHLRPQHVCLHLVRPSMYGTTCLPAARSVASHRDNESSPCAGRRAPFPHTQHRLHEEAVGFMRYESYGKAIGPSARRCRSVGKMLAKCVSQRPTVTGLRPNALLA